MIRNPNDIQEGAKKIRMLIAGYPGIGKSTLALSAPNPLHIDVDFGIDRIEPRYRPAPCEAPGTGQGQVQKVRGARRQPVRVHGAGEAEKPGTQK